MTSILVIIMAYVEQKILVLSLQTLSNLKKKHLIWLMKFNLFD